MTNATMKRRLVQGGTLSAGVLLTAALLAMGNYFAMKYYHRFDWTGARLYSLSPKTESVLGGLTKDVEVTIFMQPGTEVYAPAKELLDRYSAKSAHVKTRVVDPERNLVDAQRLVDQYKVKNLNVVVFDDGDDRRVVEEADLADYDYSGMQFGQGPKLTGFKGEEAFTSAILALVEKKKPKVLFTTGHREASLDDFSPKGLSQIKDLLGKENLDLQPWASLGQKEVPADAALVVIAGPTSSFLPPELEVLAKYLDGGGRLLVLLDPDLGSGGTLAKTGLEPWLAGYGVEVGDDIVVDPSSTLPFYGAETIFVKATGAHPIVDSLAQANVPAIFALARSIGKGKPPAGAETTTLLETSSDGWGETDLAHLGAVAKDAKDVAGPVSLAVAVAAAGPKPPPGSDEEDLEQAEAPPAAKPGEGPKWRLVVFGDSDFATNGELTNVGNPTLLANALDWMIERKNLLGIGPKKPEQVHLSLTQGQLASLTWFVLGGLPALAILAGVTVYFKRRR
jgi:ABC-type uncharacterized transport system involved in gliding motility auxiliary subunit